jgi:Na+-transporting NADH:ubiquinone oxidoreductase subunit F
MKGQNETLRDYSLIGLETEIAKQNGLDNAVWYLCPVPRDKMRELLIRKDGPAIRDTLLWFGLIFGSGYLVFLLWGSWYFIFPYILYSVLYASTSDSRWHESSHGTAFKTDWMNIVLYEIASFMVFRQSTVWRWSHTRHHSDTIIRGLDPEIAVPRPPEIAKIILGFFGLRGSIPEVKKLIIHASGKIDPEVATYLPKYEYAKVILKARIYILIYLFVIAISIIYGTILPMLFIVFPLFLGGWLMPIYGLTQHAGLQENVLDFRLNCRTVYMNRIHRYLYWNMNYHLEHHMYPLVPYHALPKLHALIKDDCPTPYKGIVDAFKEIIPTLLKQVKDLNYYADRKLPQKSISTTTNDSNRIMGIKAFLKDDRIKVCGTDDIPIGETVRFDFEQKTYAIYRTSKDKYYATEGLCTHGHAHLADGLIIGDLIECAKHNGRFNIKEGTPKRMPVTIGLQTFKIDVENSEIYLNLLSETDKKACYTDQKKIFRVISNNNVATFIKELVLEPLITSTFKFKPGEYIQIEVPPFELSFDHIHIDKPFDKTWYDLGLFNCFAKNPIYIKRNFSMASNPQTEEQLKFNIRIELPPKTDKISAGAGSSYIFNLIPGDEVNAFGPYGDFHIKQSDSEMVYVGGGAGMAPLRSHLSYLFETEKTNRKVSFWYGARSLDELFYYEYFENLQKQHPNFSFNVALSEPKSKDVWNGYTGFIHEVLFNEYLKNHPQPNKNEYYLCGPPAMIKAGLKMLKSLGVDDEMIAYDEF